MKQEAGADHNDPLQTATNDNGSRIEFKPKSMARNEIGSAPGPGAYSWSPSWSSVQALAFELVKVSAGSSMRW